jgi:hypothetical protein
MEQPLLGGKGFSGAQKMQYGLFKKAKIVEEVESPEEISLEKPKIKGKKKRNDSSEEEPEVKPKGKAMGFKKRQMDVDDSEEKPKKKKKKGDSLTKEGYLLKKKKKSLFTKQWD